MCSNTQNKSLANQQKTSSTAKLVTLLALAATVSCLVLIMLEKLSLYVHPRYTVFTAVMAASTLLLLAWQALKPTPTHTSCTDCCSSARASKFNLAICAIFIVALIALPAAPLSNERLAQRAQLDVASQTQITPKLLNSLGKKSSLQDWHSALAQGATSRDLAGKTANITGFITPAKDPNVFLISRFTITCCAVDAKPVTVPVYLPNWKHKYQTNSWVRITGFFISNPDARQDPPTLLTATSIKSIQQPANPYLLTSGER